MSRERNADEVRGVRKEGQDVHHHLTATLRFDSNPDHFGSAAYGTTPSSTIERRAGVIGATRRGGSYYRQRLWLQNELNGGEKSRFADPGTM